VINQPRSKFFPFSLLSDHINHDGLPEQDYKKSSLQHQSVLEQHWCGKFKFSSDVASVNLASGAM
jgi:hypothetical protein